MILLATKYRKVCQFIIFLSSLLMLSCSSNKPDEDTNSHLKSYVSSQEPDLPTDISVCLEQEEYRHLVDQIQASLAEELRPLGIVLSDWDLCSEREDQGKNAVHLAFDPFSATSRALDFDAEILGKPQGVLIGLRLHCPESERLKACLSNVALHEFGHVLGLHHEMNRPDNPDCELDQTGGQGEEATTQIGPYDDRSIMNYCYLNQVNEDGQRAHLSDGDKAAIRARYHGVLAAITPQTDRLSEGAPTFYISGRKLSAYRFAISRPDAHDCQEETRYSLPIDIKTPLDLTTMASDSLQRGQLSMLCVLGLADDTQQSLASFSSQLFFVPLETDREAPILMQIQAHDRHDAFKDLSIDVIVSDASDLLSINAQIEYQDVNFRTIFNKRKFLRIDQDRYRIFFPAQDILLTGPVQLKYLSLIDRNGFRSFYKQDKLQSGQLRRADEELGIDNPKIFIQSGYQTETEPPNLVSFDLTQNDITLQESFTIDMQLSEQTDLRSTYIELLHKDLQKSYLLTPSFLEKGPTHGSFRLSFWPPQNSFRGTYVISRISLRDELGNQRYYVIDANGYHFTETELIAPELRLSEGKDYEVESPQLQSILNFPNELESEQEANFQLCVRDRSEIIRADVDVIHQDGESALLTRFISTSPSEHLTDELCLQMTVTSHSFHRAGIYRINRIVLVDQFGNRSDYQLSENFMQGPGFYEKAPELRLIRK